MIVAIVDALVVQKAKTGFHGVSLVDTRWAAGHRRGGGGRRRLLQVNARSTAAKNIEVEVEKPLGLALGQKPGGGVVITVSPLFHLRFLCLIPLHEYLMFLSPRHDPGLEISTFQL